MAALEPLTMDVEINTRLVDFPLEWLVVPIAPSRIVNGECVSELANLQDELRRASQGGWDVFAVLSNPLAIVIRREIKVS